MGTMAGAYRADAKVERSPGRVEMAARRIESLRSRINATIASAEQELDRLAGHRPPSGVGGVAVPGNAPSPSDTHRLEAEAEMLEVTLNRAEDLVARLAAL